MNNHDNLIRKQTLEEVLKWTDDEENWYNPNPKEPKTFELDSYNLRRMLEQKLRETK